MDYNDNARLDTSQVEDTRGGGGGGMFGGGGGGGMLGGGGFGGRGMAFGGGGVGVVGVIIYLLISFLGNGGGTSSSSGSVLGQLGQSGQPATADNAKISSECKTGADANQHLECAVVADIDSIQGYWAGELPRLGRQYVPVKTVWFSGQVSTGCGSADSGAGPFYCPADKLVYIDLTFYNDLKTQFGSAGGPFVNAYVLAHEYGHHVQDLLGIEAKVRSRSGAASDSVRLELQADCFAGVWAKHATEPTADGQPALVSSISQDDFRNASTPPGTSATTTSRRTWAAARSTPRNSPTARPWSARSGSPPGTAPATRRRATHSARTTWAEAYQLLARSPRRATYGVSPGRNPPMDGARTTCTERISRCVEY